MGPPSRSRPSQVPAGPSETATADNPSTVDPTGRETLLRHRPDRGEESLRFPDQTAHFKVYRPPSGRWRRALAAVALGVVVVGAGAGGYMAVTQGSAGHHRAHPTVPPPPPPPPLAVVGAAITVSPAGGQLGCGDGRASYRAQVTTNGAAGTLAYQWVYPDGSLGPASQLPLSKGQKAVALSLQFTFSGSGHGGGTASLQVRPVPGAGQAFVAPLRSEAPPVIYRCP